MPKVSINIITYNRANFIREAIDSVLSQSFTDWELLILDGASSDNTEEVIKSYLSDSRIKYFKLSQRTENIPVARNIILKKSVGDYIAVLDSDDSWSDNDKISKQVDYLNRNSKYVLVGGGVTLIDDKGIKKDQYLNIGLDDQIRKAMLLKNQFAHSSVMYRREVAIAVGLYNETLRIGEDYDLFLRLGKIGKMFNFQDYFLNYRVHSGSICVADRITGLKNNISIIRSYKKDYPNYFIAYLRRRVRLIGGYVLSVFKK